MTKEKFIEFASFGLSVASISVGITLWAITTFQTKADASDYELKMDKKNQELTQEIILLRQNIDKMGRDISYIRGKIGIALGESQ